MSMFQVGFGGMAHLLGAPQWAFKTCSFCRILPVSTQDNCHKARGWTASRQTPWGCMASVSLYFSTELCWLHSGTVRQHTLNLDLIESYIKVWNTAPIIPASCSFTDSWTVFLHLVMEPLRKHGLMWLLEELSYLFNWNILLRRVCSVIIHMGPEKKKETYYFARTQAIFVIFPNFAIYLFSKQVSWMIRFHQPSLKFLWEKSFRCSVLLWG